RSRSVTARPGIALERAAHVEGIGERVGPPELELRPERDVELRLIAVDGVIRIAGLRERDRGGAFGRIAEFRDLPRHEEAAEDLRAAGDARHERALDAVVHAEIVPRVL